MPILTLQQLRTTITQEQALNAMLADLTSLGFQATSWQPGSVQRTILQAVASIWSQLSNSVAAITYTVFNDSAAGDSLTVFSGSHYDNIRQPATSTIGYVRMTGGPVGPPYAIVPGQLVVAHDTLGYTYRNITGGVVPVSGTVALQYQAEVAGAMTAVGNGTINTLQTPLAGVTVTNVPPFPLVDWIITYGQDAELDDRLRTRNRDKWASLNPITRPRDWYVLATLEQVPAITRVKVDDTNPGGPGTVDVYIAGATGPSAPAEQALAQAYFNSHGPVTALITVKLAAAAAQNITADVWITAALNTAAKQAEVLASLTAFINALPIGGEVLPPGPAGYMLLSELVGSITGIEGVRNVAMVAPVANVAIGAFNVATVGAITLTYHSI